MGSSLKYTLSYLIAFLILGSSLLVNPYFTSEFFEYPKFLFLLIGVGVFSVIWIYDFSFSKFKFQNLFPGIIVLTSIGLLLAGNFIAYSFSSDQSTALIGSPYRYQGLLTNLHYLLLGIGTFYYFRRYGQDPRLEKWLVIILVIICAVALLPMFQSSFGARVYGTFGNPNYLASVIVTLLPFLFFSKLPNLWKTLLAAFVIYILFLTGSRSAWIALTVTLLFFGGIDLYFKKRKHLLIGSLITVLAMTGIVLFQKYSEAPALDRFSVASENLNSAKTRYYLWEGGIDMFLDSPLAGYGQDQIRGNINGYIPSYLSTDPTFFVDRTHSEIIDIALTIGLFGILGYLTIILTTFFSGLTTLLQRNKLRTALIAFSTLNLYHLVNFSTISSNILLYILIGWILGSALYYKNKAATSSPGSI